MNKSNVADRLSHIDDDGIEWTNATSKNGVPFEIGIKKTDLEVTVKGESPCPSGLSFRDILKVYFLFSRSPWGFYSGGQSILPCQLAGGRRHLEIDVGRTE
jgi:hypothetical protein